MSDKVTIERETLLAALDALENARGNINPVRSYADEVEGQIENALTHLRAAVTQPVEPVVRGAANIKK